MSDFFLDYENGNDANTGADWANAWKTITSGATAARIAPGDTIKIAKSPDPVSIGDATWTDLSKVVTLAAALTLLVDDCESGWAADNASTVTHPTTAMKSGAANVQVTKATYATSTLYAHKDIGGSVDFSQHTKLTFWVRNSAAVADAATWEIRLCSDTAGATVVDTIAVPAIPSVNRWVPITVARTGGGALGAAIQSISIASGTTAPTNASTFQVDNVNACAAFSLQSLISKNSAATGGTEAWYGLQSISGATLLLDNDHDTIASGGRGYSGTTETVATYRRETIQTALATSASASVQAVQDSGTVGSRITFSGGWDTVGLDQDGETFFDGLNGFGNGITFGATSFVTFDRVNLARYSNGFRSESGSHDIAIAFQSVCNCAAGVNLTGNNDTVAGGYANNNGTGVGVGYGSSAVIASANNNTNNGVTTNGAAWRLTAEESNNNGTAAVFLGNSRDIRLRIAQIRGNGTRGITVLGGGAALTNTTISNSTEVDGWTAYANARVYSHNHDLGGYDHIFTDGGDIYSEATDFAAPATGRMWTLLTSATTRTSNYPLWLRLPGFAVVANKLVTIKAVMKKAHASQVNGRFVVPGGQLAGVDDDQVATLAGNTSEQELTLTFTPTEAGVFVPEVWAEYVSGHAKVQIDRISHFSQAA